MTGTLIHQVWAHDPTAYAPPRYRRACAYDAFLPDPISDLDLILPAEVAAAASEAERALTEINTTNPSLLRPLTRLLLRTESIASSRIEGLDINTRDLARAEVRDHSGGRTSHTAIEVLANVEAMELAIDQASGATTFGIEHLTAIHQRLMAHSPTPRIAGEIRTTQNWIGGNAYNPCGAAFVPPPPEHVPELLDDLCATINDDRWPAVIQAAMVHAQFETIHPFADGNGRTGRALIHVVLRRRGVTPLFVPPISVVFSRERDRYIDGLTRFRDHRRDDWLEHFAAVTFTASALTRRYQNDVTALLDHWRTQLKRAHRADSAVFAIIDTLPAHPVITSAIAIAATGRSAPRINQALDALTRAGILTQLTTGRRNRIWEAPALLDLIAELDATE